MTLRCVKNLKDGNFLFQKILSIVLLLIFFIANNNGFTQKFNDSLKIIFSKRGGLYPNKNFSVSLKALNKEAKIYYTLNGKEPNSSSAKYKNPIPVNKNTVLRAKLYYNGKPIGYTVTQSYFVERNYKLPVVSIVTNPDNFFSSSRGIYVKGCCADSVQPYLGANFWKSWERKINIELYEPDNTCAFNQIAGVRIFGGYSKGLPMKSLAIIGRNKYGKKYFKYQIFENTMESNLDLVIL